MSTTRYWLFGVLAGVLVILLSVCHEAGWSDWERACLMVLGFSVLSLLIHASYIAGRPVTLDWLKLRKPYVLLATMDSLQEEFKALILVRPIGNHDRKIVVVLTEKLSGVPEGRMFYVVPHLDSLGLPVKGFLAVLCEGSGPATVLAIRPPERKS